MADLHRRLIEGTGGAPGIRDLGVLASAIAQPNATFGAADLYPTLVEKAAAPCFALVRNHPFVDGNKRAGHAAMETFLVLNGTEIEGLSRDSCCPVGRCYETRSGRHADDREHVGHGPARDFVGRGLA